MNDRRVDEATGERCRFTSSIIAPWCRQEPEGVRGAAVDVLARDLDRGFRSRLSASSSAPMLVCRRR